MLCHFNVFGETAVQCEQCGRVIENKAPEIPIYSACRVPANNERQAQSRSPAITVVMPVWNGEKYLHQAIDSILNQTQKDFELIIVNDGSTDSTPDIINHIARQSDNVFVIHQPNKGTGAALNAGFAIARGKYQTWWSADSWVEPNWLSELQQALDNNPDFGFVYSDWKRLHQESGHERVIVVPDFDRTRLQKECYIGPSWMWRKEIKDQVGEFSVDLCEDYDMHLRMAGATPFLHLPEVLVHWRDHQDNVTNRICRPQHFAPGLRVRARHKWKHSQMRVAWIGPYVDAASVGWFLANGLNEVGDDQIAVRHILGKHRHMNQIEDLLIDRDDDEIRRVLDESDLIHCNVCLPDDKYSLFDFRPWLANGKPMLLHLHGGHWPLLIDRIEQYQREYNIQVISCTPGISEIFPNARWMPNYLPLSEQGNLHDESYFTPPANWPAVTDPLRVMFHHNYTMGKGGEIIKVLFKWLKEEVGVQLDTSFRCTNPIPLRDHLKEKKQFDICIDQITQGFIGMAGWESMAQGAVVIARLDEFSIKAYTDLGQGDPPPILNARWIDEVGTYLIRLSRDPDMVLDLKRQGRDWMMRHYSARRIADHWISLYRDVIQQRG